MKRKIIYSTTGVAKFDYALESLDNHLALSGKAMSTRKRYTFVLYRFMTTYNRLPEECTKQEIVNYFMRCKKSKGFHSTTIRSYMCGLKYYLKHIVHRLDLYEQIPNPATRKYDINVLTIREVNTLFENCRNYRELLIIQLLYETGIRVGELTKLNLDDIDFDNQTITVRNSKNGNTRTISFGDNLCRTIRMYLNTNKSLFSDSLFYQKFHPFMPITRSSLRSILKALVRRSGITKRVNLHSMRHTFAVHYLNFGGTIYQLQKILGHSHLSTTIHYLKYAVLPESSHISVIDKLKEKTKAPQLAKIRILRAV